jgi:hypothetical protein
MWFTQQLNTFLNLGECKEYPIMAKSKSTPGSKVNRTNPIPNPSNEQNGTSNSAILPELSAVAETAPAVVPEVKATPEARVTPDSKTKLEAKAAPDARKFELMKNESRTNVVPINLDDEIRRRAYELYQQRGSGHGSEAADWLNAEREVRQRYRQQSA